MRSKVEPGDSVFIYARAASGPPMPLAATRTSIGDLPVTVTLDDSQAMTPQMRLSSFDQIIVGARVSKSGQALPQPGDLEGISTPISITNQPSIAVTIDRVR
jgi:cytochrome c-type biogenesis protein CcmH